MPWSESRIEEERRRLITLVERNRLPVAEAARLVGVSRKTAFKWLARYREGGLRSLADQSRAPHTHPGAHGQRLHDLLLAGRREHRYWGPRKLVAFLALRRPELVLPAPSTVGLWLKGAGLVGPRRLKTKWETLGTGPFAPVQEPNDVWCTDYKGEFRVGNRELCYPFTLSDAHTRFLIRVTAMRQISGRGAQQEMESAFREYGLPRAMRSDNGTPFAAHGVGGLTKLSVWLLRLGVQLQRIDLGRPQQNGSHERMHRTLKQETALEPKSTLRQQQKAFDAFRGEFNHHRPHEALGNVTPASLFKPSPRSMPNTLPDVHYPTNYAVRMVQDKGYLKWNGKVVFLSEALHGHPVGLVPSNLDGFWHVYFTTYELGLLHASGEFVERIHRPSALGSEPTAAPPSPM